MSCARANARSGATTPRLRGRVRACADFRAPQPHHVLQHMRAIADYAEIDLHVLVDRGGVDVDVDLFGMRREGVEPASDAVVETRAQADHQIAIVHRVIGFERSVHAEHAEPLFVGSRVGGPDPSSVEVIGKAGQTCTSSRSKRRGVRSRVDDAAAGGENRLRFAFAISRDGLLDLVDVALSVWVL